MRKSHRNEGHVKDDVKELLKKHKWWYWMPPGSAFGTPNVDINALHEGGNFLAIETKFGGNKPTPNQVKFLRAVILHDGLALVVDEHRIGTLATWLEAFDMATKDASRGLEPVPMDNPELMAATKLLTAEIFAE